jgi:hypothetical protein
MVLTSNGFEEWFSSWIFPRRNVHGTTTKLSEPNTP